MYIWLYTIWFALSSRWWKMVTSFLPNDSLLHCSRHPITAESLTMRVEWWVWMKPSCVLSRYEKQYAIFLLSFFFAQCTFQLHSGLVWKVALSGFTIPDMLPTTTKHSERAAQNMSQECVKLICLFFFLFLSSFYYIICIPGILLVRYKKCFS